MKLMDIQIAFKIRCSQNGRADEAGDEGTFFVCYTFQYKHVESGRYAKIPFSQFITIVSTVNVVGWLVLRVVLPTPFLLFYCSSFHSSTLCPHLSLFLDFSLNFNFIYCEFIQYDCTRQSTKANLIVLFYSLYIERHITDTCK